MIAGKNGGMKSNRFRCAAQFLAAAGVLVLAGCQSVPETTPAGPGARVVAVQGRTRCSDASQTWRKVGEGDALLVSNVLQTALASSVDIAVAVAGSTEADRILLQSDTVLFVEGLPGESVAGGGNDGASLKLHLRMGELTFTGPPSGKGSPCEIRFAKGLAGARGATFKLRSDGQLKVFRGVVALKPSDGQAARTIPAGNQYDLQTGELTAIPVGDTASPLAPPTTVRPVRPSWPPWPTRKY